MLEVTRSLLPLWEKVDWRGAPRRMRGAGRNASACAPSNTPHPISLRPATFSHKGRRKGPAPHPPFGLLLPVNGEKERHF